ncbi:LD-carboxypeptidase, partial [filamentous cyanobacterium CCP2]
MPDFSPLSPAPRSPFSSSLLPLPLKPGDRLRVIAPSGTLRELDA